MFGSSYNHELAQDMINFLSYKLSKRDYEISELLQMLKDEFSNDSYYGNRDISAYTEEVEEAFDAVEINDFIEWREKQELMENNMSKVLKERWNRLAFGKGNQSLNESDRFHGVLPQELWELSDYEDYRDSGIDLRGYSDEELQMKIEQLLEEIEEEKQYMDDPQNQYDSAIAPKESLINFIQDIIDQGVHQR